VKAPGSEQTPQLFFGASKDFTAAEVLPAERIAPSHGDSSRRGVLKSDGWGRWMGRTNGRENGRGELEG